MAIIKKIVVEQSEQEILDEHRMLLEALLEDSYKKETLLEKIIEILNELKGSKNGSL